jgi:hypothetical protein
MNTQASCTIRHKKTLRGVYYDLFTVRLAFAGFTKTDDWINPAKEGEYIPYFVIVKKIKGEGFAKRCEGFLTVVGTAISNAPTVWAHALLGIMTLVDEWICDYLLFMTKPKDIISIGSFE